MNTVNFEEDGQMSFEDLDIDPKIIKGLKQLGFQYPFEVQISCLQPIKEGRHVSLRSKTGSGKTAAFGIPLLENIKADNGKPSLLVLAPTRELAGQIAAELTAIGQYKKIRVIAAYGGASISQQRASLKKGAQVVVGTPGRLLDLYRQGVLALDAFKTIVLDEADEMLSMGFFEDVTQLMDHARQCKQVVTLSASLDSQTQALIDKYSPDVVRIDLSADVLSVEGIENIYYSVPDELPRYHYLLHLLTDERPSSAIVFVNTRSDASLIATVMAREGLQAEMISGALPQNERERVMKAIRSSKLKYLVATDLAARGIDISDLSHVINYSLPEDPAVFLHRVGRTGRVNKKGVAISLVSGKRFHTLSVLEKEFGVTFEERKFPLRQDIIEARTKEQLRCLDEASEDVVCDGFMAQARGLIEHDKAEQMIAYLLKMNADKVHDQQRSRRNQPERGRKNYPKKRKLRSRKPRKKKSW
jgi:ATP-dependent RNA helicase DeaD